MIREVRLRYFKQFEEQTFDLSDHLVLAGPNNSGKTTLLQAIVVWSMALRRWTAERKPEAKGRIRRGVPITRKDFSAIPLREMNLLWTNRSTGLKKDEGRPGYPRPMEVEIRSDDGWKVCFEFRYQSAEQVYVRPLESDLDSVSLAAESVAVVHVPPFSGIGVQETRYDRPYQDLLIGQGKPGDVLRNLLLEIHADDDKSAWNELVERVVEVFGYHLLAPEYEGRPFIVCEYVAERGAASDKNVRVPLDISSAGSGFHQVLMLLAFFYARESTVLLLDEPDAHLHVILQKQIYDLLRSVASKRRCQLIVATHAEVLIDSTSPNLILSFYRAPHRLVSNTERDQVREALKRLPATDLLLAENARSVLYVESESDFNLLRAWAGVLSHKAKRWFDETPFWHANRGRDPKEARGHYFALKGVRPEISGVLLLDGDNRGLPEDEMHAESLRVLRWRRYEAESYLVNPAMLLRFLEASCLPLMIEPARRFLVDQLPPAIARAPLDDHPFFDVSPVSKDLLPQFFAHAGVRITKPEYYLVAEQMRPEEIPAEVVQKLDQICEAFGL